VTSHVAVIGGGVAGLTVAYRLSRSNVDVTVFEAAEHVGGRLASIEVGGLELDAGADSFVARKPWAVDLCRELGIGLVAPGASGAHLWTAEGLVRMLRDAPFGIPGDVGDVLRWPGLSRRGRRRAMRDLVIRRRRDGAEETIGGLLRRRFGDEVTDLALAPILGGISAGDVDQLSALATFPELVAWEERQGSLIRGSQAATRAAAGSDAGPLFLRPRPGVRRLPDELARAVGPDRVRTGEPVGSLPEADAVVLAAPAFEAARLLADAAPDAAPELTAIRYASTGVVLLVYPPGTADALPEGTGFVVPRGRAPMTAATWLSRKWPDPAFGDRAVVRCYVGADGEEDVLDAPDADLVAACERHLAALVELPEAAEHAAVHRWPRSMPQSEVGHRDRVRRARDLLPAGIFVVGNAYDGVGVADTVRGANDVAERVAAFLGTREPIS
jgi:oxygen-dependent protoporphyrinogen oxidase